jgi:hypothetical protein
MNQVNLDVMDDLALKQYFLANRQDPVVVQAYLDRFSQRQKSMIASPQDPSNSKFKTSLRHFI